MTPVKSTRLRSSGTRQALASQLNICFLSRLRLGLRRLRRLRLRLLRLCGALLLLRDGLAAQEGDAAAGLLDLRARARGERVRGHAQLLRQLALAQDLHVGSRVLQNSGLDEGLRRHLRAGVEPLEVADIHRHRRRAERTDRHRVLRGRAALLAEPHVDGHLAALEAGAHLRRAGAGLLALDPAPGIATFAGAEAAADALAIAARRGGLEVREVQLVGHYLASSTWTRWRTFRSIPASCGLSACSATRPILPSPSARRTPRWACVSPIGLRVCVIRTFAISWAPRSSPRPCGGGRASAQQQGPRRRAPPPQLAGRAPRREPRPRAPRARAPRRARDRAAPARSSGHGSARRPRGGAGCAARRPSPSPC